ncbi:hypothetical protein AVEN_132982-1 [Araneus ventricosus]|uniref:Uncharacterized protein n=1 Tax=Araneus ventricosus TaxID=182803 RepID=A0A4Y2NN11_ARAVE|nr:hypothetical protein AVEN_132982-1 [Araneus ventricosus]
MRLISHISTSASAKQKFERRKDRLNKYFVQIKDTHHPLIDSSIITSAAAETQATECSLTTYWHMRKPKRNLLQEWFTECSLITYWYMRKPKRNLLQEWLKRVAH